MKELVSNGFVISITQASEEMKQNREILFLWRESTWLNRSVEPAFHAESFAV